MCVFHVFSVVQMVSNCARHYIYREISRCFWETLGRGHECFFGIISMDTLKENESVTFFNSFVEIYCLIVRRFVKYYKFELKFFKFKCFLWKCIVLGLNPFEANVLFLYTLKCLHQRCSDVLTYLFPMHPFSTPWKHQNVEKGCIKNKWEEKTTRMKAILSFSGIYGWFTRCIPWSITVYGLRRIEETT